jgi:hypothetical protein
MPVSFLLSVYAEAAADRDDCADVVGVGPGEERDRAGHLVG